MHDEIAVKARFEAPPAPGADRRRRIVRALLICAALALAATLVLNVRANLAAAGLRLDFSFLLSESGFELNESLIRHSARHSYLNALAAGLLNTLQLAVLGVIGATLAGSAMAAMRLSGHPLLDRAAGLFIGAMRNLPKLLILLAVYVIMVRELPPVREAWSFGDVMFLSNRGLELPTLRLKEGGGAMLAAACGAFALAVAVARQRRRVRVAGALAAALAAGAVLAAAAAVSTEAPRFSGFNFSGGLSVSSSLICLGLALSMYHGAQVAEVMRAAVLAVPDGQREAAAALGLGPWTAARLVVIPQALRLMAPPMANQYVNLLKNTSIGLLIGYSDLTSVMNTATNQTFRPIELMSICLLFYVGVGLTAARGVRLLEGSGARG